MFSSKKSLFMLLNPPDPADETVEVRMSKADVAFPVGSACKFAADSELISSIEFRFG